MPKIKIMKRNLNAKRVSADLLPANIELSGMEMYLHSDQGFQYTS